MPLPRGHGARTILPTRRQALSARLARPLIPSVVEGFSHPTCGLLARRAPSRRSKLAERILKRASEGELDPARLRTYALIDLVVPRVRANGSRQIRRADYSPEA